MYVCVCVMNHEQNINLCTQAKEKEAIQYRQKIQEVDDNYREMSNQIHGDMLSEKPDVALSAFGPHREVPDRWKGMSPAQVWDVLDTRERQRQEREVFCFAVVLVIIVKGEPTMLFSWCCYMKAYKMRERVKEREREREIGEIL